MSYFHFLGSTECIGRVLPGDKRIVKPTIPGSQGQTSSTSVLEKLEFVLE